MIVDELRELCRRLLTEKTVNVVIGYGQTTPDKAAFPIFITKPEDPAELEARLRSLLNNLTELCGITRGAGGLETTARSVMQPGSLAMRRAVAWGMAVAILVGLVIFALVTGVIG